MYFLLDGVLFGGEHPLTAGIDLGLPVRKAMEIARGDAVDANASRRGREY